MAIEVIKYEQRLLEGTLASSDESSTMLNDFFSLENDKSTILFFDKVYIVQSKNYFIETIILHGFMEYKGVTVRSYLHFSIMPLKKNEALLKLDNDDLFV